MSASSITTSVTVRELRGDLADALSRAGYGHERVLITKNGKPAAVLIGPEDFELLEQLEMQRDVAEFRAARADDDGSRVSLADLRAELAETADRTLPADHGVAADYLQ